MLATSGRKQNHMRQGTVDSLQRDSASARHDMFYRYPRMCVPLGKICWLVSRLCVMTWDSVVTLESWKYLWTERIFFPSKHGAATRW